MILDSGKPADPTTIELTLLDAPPSGFALPQDVTAKHTIVSHTATRCPRRRSMLIATDTSVERLSRWFGSLQAGRRVKIKSQAATRLYILNNRQRGKDDTMSSDPSVSPEQPPDASAPVPDSLPPPDTAVKFTRRASVWSPS